MRNNFDFYVYQIGGTVKDGCPRNFLNIFLKVMKPQLEIFEWHFATDG